MVLLAAVYALELPRRCGDCDLRNRVVSAQHIFLAECLYSHPQIATVQVKVLQVLQSAIRSGRHPWLPSSTACVNETEGGWWRRVLARVYFPDTSFSRFAILTGAIQCSRSVVMRGCLKKSSHA